VLLPFLFSVLVKFRKKTSHFWRSELAGASIAWYETWHAWLRIKHSLNADKDVVLITYKACKHRRDIQHNNFLSDFYYSLQVLWHVLLKPTEHTSFLQKYVMTKMHCVSLSPFILTDSEPNQHCTSVQLHLPNCPYYDSNLTVFVNLSKNISFYGAYPHCCVWKINWLCSCVGVHNALL
jgi:hypothetical protein